MHLAVCIDHPANRKQMERLLKRASDKRASENAFYIDSYGNSTSLMHKLQLYDAYYIDMLNDSNSTLELVTELIKAGVHCPIILCPSEIDYKSQIYEDIFLSAYLDTQISFLPQPILPEQLEASISIIEKHLSSAVPKIELRDDRDTYYVEEDDILYAVCKKNNVFITLSDKRIVTILSSRDNFLSEMCFYTNYKWITPNVMINTVYIKKTGLLFLTMTDGKRFLKYSLHHKK